VIPGTPADSVGDQLLAIRQFYTEGDPAKEAAAELTELELELAVTVRIAA